MPDPQHNVGIKRSIGNTGCSTHAWFVIRCKLCNVFVPEASIVTDGRDHRAIRYTYHIKRYGFFQPLHLEFPDVCCCINIVGLKNSVTRNYPRFLCIKGIKLNTSGPMDGFSIYPTYPICILIKSPCYHICPTCTSVRS